ncbi:MAG: DDE-type integrase/transposase/recombinase [Geminocystis sp.]|nr:DDE-type integrase/transposase/recombinase [Geminocystis sp.]HIK37586.1 IS6 family transposase [Geminocystis sp. M7585_C2015_104]MCS7146611.1 DDE-type integrase/transposase/recombinase [Geminocystis sp.]MCX8077490.1 DDE-type integrase/transposase/recombinase [Geminocystis sp.]MDW8115437.1 DDE-type integrase/transposase/recombinase [Geminocystis sp.]
MRENSQHQWDQIREEIILLCIQWYVTDNLTYSQLRDLMQQRGFKIDPRTINCLVKEYSHLAKKRAKETQRKRRRGWRLVQIPFILRGRRKYLYRAVDAQGNTIDFLITGSRNKDRARKFFQQTIPHSLEDKPSGVLPRREIRLGRNNLILSILSLMALSGVTLFLFSQIQGKSTGEEKNQSGDKSDICGIIKKA